MAALFKCCWSLYFSDWLHFGLSCRWHPDGPTAGMELSQVIDEGVIPHGIFFEMRLRTRWPFEMAGLENFPARNCQAIVLLSGLIDAWHSIKKNNGVKKKNNGVRPYI